MYYNYIRMTDEGIETLGSLVVDLTPTDKTQIDEKSGDLVMEPQTPRPQKEVVEIHICPICLHPCVGSAELMEHYWGYCQKTRTYFDTMMTVGE